MGHRVLEGGGRRGGRKGVRSVVNRQVIRAITHQGAVTANRTVPETGEGVTQTCLCVNCERQKRRCGRKLGAWVSGYSEAVRLYVLMRASVYKTVHISSASIFFSFPLLFGN